MIGCEHFHGVPFVFSERDDISHVVSAQMGVKGPDIRYRWHRAVRTIGESHFCGGASRVRVA
jgi:hypothetical protein